MSVSCHPISGADNAKTHVSLWSCHVGCILKRARLTCKHETSPKVAELQVRMLGVSYSKILFEAVTWKDCVIYI